MNDDEFKRLQRLRWAWSLLSNNEFIYDNILMDADPHGNICDHARLQDCFGIVDPKDAPEPIQPFRLLNAWFELVSDNEL